VNKIVFIDPDRNCRAGSAPAGELCAFHRAPDALWPAHAVLTRIWRVDFQTVRLEAGWSLKAAGDPARRRHISHVSHCAAGIAAVARAAEGRAHSHG
jgi:hypothetical protein